MRHEWKDCLTAHGNGNAQQPPECLNLLHLYWTQPAYPKFQLGPAVLSIARPEQDLGHIAEAPAGFVGVVSDSITAAAISGADVKPGRISACDQSTSALARERHDD